MSGPRICTFCGEWPAMNPGPTCDRCDDIRHTKENPVPGSAGHIADKMVFKHEIMKLMQECSTCAGHREIPAFDGEGNEIGMDPCPTCLCPPHDWIPSPSSGG